MTDNSIAVEEKTHALLGPSGAHRWANCPGSIVLEAGKEDNAGYHANWGTAAHELAAIVLEPWNGERLTSLSITDIENINAEGYIGRVFEVAGDKFEVDMDMATCVNDYVAQLATLLDVGDILLVEQELPIEHITGEKGATGTSDAVIIKAAAKQIVSADLKTGKGVTVYAERNPQCTMYTEGAIYGLDPIYGPFDGWERVNAIVQPRIEHYDVEYVSEDNHNVRVAHLREAAERVTEARREAALNDAEGVSLTGEWSARYLDPGPEQCKFCKAKATCPALRGEVSSGLARTAPASREDFPDLTLPKQASAAAGEVSKADADDLAEALRAAPLVEAWLKAVREEAFTRAMDGDRIPGFKLVRGKKGNRVWSDAAEAEEVMKAARVKVDDMYTKTLISFPAAEKMFKDRQKLWAKLAPLMSQSEGSPSLAPESDRRAVYTPPRAEAEDFPDLGEDEVDPFS